MGREGGAPPIRVTNKGGVHVKKINNFLYILVGFLGRGFSRG